ncbi:dienelactone hydrolase [Novosphingobium marinum]|uniref:Dienelactone hydrolase n=1 Tax=Novosphingobium marinum TaxID=1514948 RepID=A0A7Y9XVM4_9SPHN|nr:dienelactone hydrolase family protein [Novosphingobium marinum]NYH94200.1 dienelactone hydrolase [Novosphingobium marinum]GGC20416.1 dienelactone hydrolase [Novosphingobium marinum]
MIPLERVGYRDGEVELTGLLARPWPKPRAAVILFPTIANQNDAVERRAEMLADAGFLALVADFYGFNPGPDAMFEAAEPLRADAEVFRKRLRPAVARMREIAGDETPLAAIGYCLGGQAALEIARDGADLAAAVSFHGLLGTHKPAGPGSIRGRILVCHGDADPLAPRSDVMAFWEEMDRAGADWHFHSYGKVRHGFTDPLSDERDMDAVAYDASADRQSWAAMTSLFDELFPD